MASSSYSLDWYGKTVWKRIDQEIGQRVGLATSFLKRKVLFNISVPVKVTVGPKGGVIKERSKPGEFPRRDFALLSGTMMSGVERVTPGVYEGYVGTPLDYGVKLEIEMNRSFLLRTFYQKLGVIQTMLVKPMRTK